MEASTMPNPQVLGLRVQKRNSHSTKFTKIGQEPKVPKPRAKKERKTKARIVVLSSDEEGNDGEEGAENLTQFQGRDQKVDALSLSFRSLELMDRK